MSTRNARAARTRIVRVAIADARAVACAAGALLLLASCARPVDPKLAQYEAAEKAVSAHITTFDTLDFDVFTHQKWDRLQESHSKDIVVHWPDGHQTQGIERHIEDLKAMFVYAPDTRIETHPVKFGAGDWTGVIGVMEGTFTKPMPMPNGKSIPPTGKAFKLEMCTVGHWKDGVMDEEFLFWDNLTYMRQLGLAK
jgi:SnoaL-like polyketide cyclase